MTSELADRSAVITGASLGLGERIARRFVEAGAGVLLVARTESALTRVQRELRGCAATGASVEVLAGDVTRPETAAEIGERAARLRPPCAVLVNNAGIYGPMGAIDAVDFDAWEQTLQINLVAPVRILRSLLPLLRRRGFGKVINLSGGGATAPMPFISSYAASKTALVRLTETFALELRGGGIDVNALAPGALNTRMLDEVLEAGADIVGQDYYQRALKQKADGGASLDRAAALAVFLASAKSDGISGRLISAVWDDWEALPEQREKVAESDVYTLRRIVPEDRGWEKK